MEESTERCGPSFNATITHVRPESILFHPVQLSRHTITLMDRQYDVVIERDADGYFVASVPQLHGCHTQARSLDELMPRIREAIELCLEVQ